MLIKYKSYEMNTLITELNLISETNRNIHISGEKNLGKSTILKNLQNTKLKNQKCILIKNIDLVPFNKQFALFLKLKNKKNTKILSTSSFNLALMVEKNKFNPSLFMLINQYHIFIPPLRKRKDDIKTIIRHFLYKEFKRNHLLLSKDVYDILTNYNWPGNIYEIKEVIKKISQLKNRTLINTSKIFELNLSFLYETNITPPHKIEKLKTQTENFQKENIKLLLKFYNGNKTIVAKKLGISRMSLYRKLFPDNPSIKVM